LHPVSTVLGAISGMTAPAVLVSACGLLMLGLYNKYSRVVGSLRALYAESRHRKVDGLGTVDREHRAQQIASECSVLRVRLRNVLAQIVAVASAMVMFLLASLAIGAALLLSAPATTAAVLFIIAGIVALILAMVLAALEARFIWDVICTEMNELPAPN